MRNVDCLYRYKLFNALVFCMAFVINSLFANDKDSRRPLYYVILMAITLFICFGAIFMLDAIKISNKSRNALLTMIVLFLLMSMLQTYFTYQDLSYNPLKSYDIYQTNISFKNMQISSTFHIALFTAKPLVMQFSKAVRGSTIYKKLKRTLCCCSKSKKIKTDNVTHLSTGSGLNLDPDVPCYLVHKRPLLRWIKI